MRILTGLTYYHPYLSGLSVYAVRLARGLAARGHQVTVLTSRYDKRLPAREILDGVQVVRLPVGMRLSKGVLMPGMPRQAWRLIRQADLVHLHLPQLDAAYLSLMAPLLGKPLVLTYHCDLILPPGALNGLAGRVSNLASHVAARLAKTIVTNTQDYAETSPFLRAYLPKVRAIPPPFELPEVTDAQMAAFRQKAGLQPGERVIGMAGRLAAEKGAEYLAAAMPQVLRQHPGARVLHYGQYQNVLGEEAYARKMAPLVEALGRHWTYLGSLPPAEAAAFYKTCEVSVLPSTNRTESFGMVQIESMSSGVPVVAADLPGVRQPVRQTGMGLLVPPADAAALAQALIAVLDHPERYRGDAAAVRQRYATAQIATEYEAVFQEAQRG